MMSKKIPIITASIVIPIVIFGIFIGSTDFLEEEYDAEINQVPIYIPSDITKANPNFIKIEGGQLLLSTNKISDVKNNIVYTIQGTVLSIDDPVDWKTGIIHSTRGPSNNVDVVGFIPVTISVEKVYKGNLLEDTFTFYLNSHKFDEQYLFYGETENFEIGEKVLVHLSHTDGGPFVDGQYHVALSYYGKYQLQPIGSFSTDSTVNNIEDSAYLAFNPKYPNGISLDVVVGESLP